MATEVDREPLEESGAGPTLSVTFDNLGEAADLQLGLWPERRPRGRHPSVLRVLPRLLRLLERLDLEATFFVEGLNARLYPDALHAIADGGHEIGCHAWCHEAWGTLTTGEEAEVLRRATEALAGIGHRPVGFRPPGGKLTSRSRALLIAHEYRYASPAGARMGMTSGLACLPFQRAHVDAYHLYPRAGGMREQLVSGVPRTSGLAGALPPGLKARTMRVLTGIGSLTGADRLRATMAEAIDGLVREGAYLVLLFHPFLLDSTRTMRAMTEVLEYVARLADSGALAVAPMADVADRVASSAR